MTGKGHLNVGIALSIAGYAIAGNLGYNIIAQIFCAVGVIMGAKAPDYLEIWRKTNNGYAPMIKHRTITHWFFLWLFLFLSMYSILAKEYQIYNYLTENTLNPYFIKNIEYFYAFLLGYFMGGISHLIVDIPNKKPIPIFTPFDRFSLNIWKSGEFEKLIVFVFLVGSLHYADIINIKEVINKIVA